jgi:hypothetical protein
MINSFNTAMNSQQKKNNALTNNMKVIEKENLDLKEKVEQY